MTSLKFRVVLCRIRLLPKLISKIKWLWSELLLKYKSHKHLFIFLVGQLKQISRAIGNELDDQAILIDSLSAEVDSAHGRMNATLAKIQRVTRQAKIHFLRVVSVSIKPFLTKNMVPDPQTTLDISSGLYEFYLLRIATNRRAR